MHAISQRIPEACEKTCCGLLACYVRSVTSINLDKVAFVDEERDTNLCTGFNSCRLGSICCSITLEAWFSVSNLENDLYRNFTYKNCICRRIDRSLDNIAFLEEINTSDDVTRNSNLLESLLIHEYQVFTFLIKVLELTMVNNDIFKLC